MPDQFDRERQRIRKALQRDRILPEDETRRQGPENQGPEFDHAANVYMGDCPVCQGRVAFHCDSCKIPVTMCKCVLQKKIDEEVAGLRRQAMGLWTPPTEGN